LSNSTPAAKNLCVSTRKQAALSITGERTKACVRKGRVRQHAQRLLVMLEPAERRHGGVQRLFPGMTERRVTEIMSERYLNLTQKPLVLLNQVEDGLACHRVSRFCLLLDDLPF
jgi:hypothetical protein